MKRGSSKYDFVKVKVWIGDHYYVLSRFLLARLVTVTMIPPDVASAISLSLKKSLVDTGALNISQRELETRLVEEMQNHGYSTLYHNRFRMVRRFNHHRIPVLICVSGAPCSGLSTVAALLSDRLNMSAVLLTETVHCVLCGKPPCWSCEYQTNDCFLNAYASECESVRQGLTADFVKCLTEGKSMIFCGSHLDPDKYSSLLNGVLSADSAADRRADSADDAARSARSDHLPLVPVQSVMSCFNSANIPNKDVAGLVMSVLVKCKIPENIPEHLKNNYTMIENILSSRHYSLIVDNDPFDPNFSVEKIHEFVVTKMNDYIISLSD